MEFSIRHIGHNPVGPSSGVELTVTSKGSSVTEDVTDIYGKVDDTVIASLREIADELERQNELLEMKK